MRLAFWVVCSFVACNAHAQTNYYLDATGGNDANTGTSPANAWRTLENLNAVSILPGDSVLFKRGEIWRGQLLPKSGNSDARVYYGAFGTGNKPQLRGSDSRNAQSDWQLVSGNIWKCNTTYPIDIGNIIFDNEASVGKKKWVSGDLQQQDDFFYNGSLGELYLYSLQNPANVHTSIELAIRRFIIDHSNCAYATFENLDLRYGGAHGFGGQNTQFLIIRNCQISFMGGGDLMMNGTNIRYGNGIEFWGNAIGNLVEQNLIFEIYDTGLTNQNHTNTVVQRDITYRYNIIYNCGMAALEIWNRPTTSVTSNIHFENNTCYNSGYGWGKQRPDYSGAAMAFWNNESQMDSVFIRNNILVNSQRTTYFFENPDGPDSKIMDHNVLWNPHLTDTICIIYPIVAYRGMEMTNYQTGTGFDTHGVYGDPAFVSISGHDFHLTTTSPAIDAGEDLGFTYDFDGNAVPMSNAPDVGALEYMGNASVGELNTSDWKVFPNPVQSLMHISGKAGIADFTHSTVYNSLGMPILEIHSESTDVSQLPAGLYWIHIQSEPTTVTVPFVRM